MGSLEILSRFPWVSWKSLSDSHGYPGNPCPIHMGTLEILVRFTWVAWKSLADSHGYHGNPCPIHMGTMEILVRFTWVPWKSLSYQEWTSYVLSFENLSLSTAGVYIKVTCGILLHKQWRESRTFWVRNLSISSTLLNKKVNQALSS